MPCYSFQKRSVLFASPEGMPGPGAYYPSLVDMRGLKGFPFPYAIFFSTDHDGGEGGIWLYVCRADPWKPSHWISYDQAAAEGAFDHVPDRPAANPIFHETVQGAGHTETPYGTVIGGVLHLTYHKNHVDDDGGQATMLATSTNGVTFRRIRGDKDSIILRYKPRPAWPLLHTGYFRWTANPFKGIPHAYVGWSLHGGGDDYHSALWASDNARRWKRLAVVAPSQDLPGLGEEDLIAWHGMDPGSIRRIGRSEYAAISNVGNRASGAVARRTELCEVYLAADGVTLTRPPVKLVRQGRKGRPDAEEVAVSTVFTAGGKIRLLYNATCDGGTRNCVMTATGSFDPAGAPAERLKGRDRSKHIAWQAK